MDEQLECGSGRGHLVGQKHRLTFTEPFLVTCHHTCPPLCPPGSRLRRTEGLGRGWQRSRPGV